MFSGIVRSVGEIVSVEPLNGGVRLGIRAVMTGIELGSSLAVNGVCLTVAEMRNDAWYFDAVGATLERTRIGELRAGDRVNLEPSLRLGDPLDGHLVTGHVDGLGTVRARRAGQGAVWFTIAAPGELMAQIALRGSVAVDGVSLTVADVEAEAFKVSIVPYTLEATVFGDYETGRRVHLETDVLAKYVERAVSTLALETRKSS
jgi:riboflavin synthase